MTLSADRPLAILSAPGSRGDVNPMVLVGKQLKHRGYDVVISLAENYVDVALDAGLIPEVAISRDDFNAMLSDSSVWRPFSGVRKVLGGAASGFIEPHWDIIAKHHRRGRTILVAHPLDFASRIYRDHDPTTPLVSVHLSPAVVRDINHPPRLSPWWFELRRPPWAMRAAYAFADHLADRWLAPSVNAKRRKLGLARISRVLDRWWLSPDLVLGLYPEWFGKAIPNCSGPWIRCGFAMAEYDLSKSRGTDTREAVFVTPGTAHQHAQDFFTNAVRACEVLELRCILATSHPAQLPKDLPSHVTVMGYVPLVEVLHQCRAIIHHGGIGTTASALQAGCAQLICPLAFDQFHNADCVSQLGVGAECTGAPWSKSPSAQQAMVDSLRRISTDAVLDTCQQLARKQLAYQGDQQAAEQIDRLLQGHTHLSG